MKNLLDKILLLALAGGLGLLARAEAPTMFVDSLELKVGNITDKKEFANFPVLVNVSEKLPGFLISRSGGAEGDGSAIRFSQKNEEGEDVILSHELVSTLKDVDGKCTNFTFWVKIPTLKADTTIKMYWGVKDGMRPPVNRPTLVWSEYYGVWHHAGLSDISVKDASGNGLDAEKLMGTDKMETTVAYLAVKSDKLPPFETSGEFAFTASYKAADDCLAPQGTWATAPILFGTWSSTRVNGYANHQYDTGWGGGWWASSGTQPRLIYRGSSRDPNGQGDDWMGFGNNDTFLYTKPTFVAFNADSLTDLRIYAATDQTALTEGTHRNSKGWITPGEGKMLRLTRIGAYEMTEARLSKYSRSADWLKEEFATLSNDSYVRVATGAKHEVYPAGNYWIEEPSLSTLAWDGKSTMEVKLGKAALGGPKSFVIENAAGTKKFGDDFEAFKEKNDGHGAYRVVVSTATTDNGVPIKQLKKVIYFAYVSQVQSSTLAANQIMLFNDVKKRDSEEYLVAGQGVEAGHWEKFATDDNGEVHIKQSCDNGWSIHYGTIGNVASEAETLSGVNCLPFGPEDSSDMVAMDYRSSTRPATDLEQAGAAILYNYSDSEDPAAIYSPYYEQGIGEIYFDAVNANSEYRNRLALQYLTGDEAASATPNWGSAAVKTATLEVLTIKDGSKASTWQNLDFVPLMMSGSNSSKSFYRVKAKIDVSCGVRFRIVRIDSSWGALGLTGPGKILVDNILVKDPTTKVSLSRIGDVWDKNRDFGKHLHGDRGTLTKRFPKVGDEEVRARVHVDYEGFGSDLSSRVGNVAALIFKYRRRYLKSEIGEWKSIRMECESDDLSSGSTFITPESEPLDLGKKGDLPFDIEYAFEGALNPTSYKYVDYYGLGSDCAFDNGNGSAITLSYNGEKEGLKPTLGNDFFIRLREGDSDFEQMEVLWKFDGDNNVVTNNLRLIEDNLWTGAIAVTNADLRLGFKLRGVNKSDTYEDGYWRMSDESEEATSSPYTNMARPVTEQIREDSGFKWIAANLVRDTRQFIFRFNDKSGAVSVCRGDYQDFNVWTDAAATNGVFVARTGKTGEDPVANSILQKRFPSSMSKNVFEDWDVSVATNSLWTEKFTTTWSPEQEALTDKLLGTDAVGELTPNSGWIGKNFMYVNESRSRIYSGSYNSRAVLLSADGSGSLKNTRAPDGIDEISFDARLGQQHAYNRVSSYVGFDTPTKDYLVSARVVMSNVAKDANQLGFDGQGTVSLFAYHNANGSYEFRMKRLSGNKLQIGLYRWYQEFGSSEIKVKELKSFDCNANGADNYTGGGQVPGMALCTQGTEEAANTNEAYVVFFGVQTMTDDQGVVTGNQLYAGFSNGNPSGKLSNHPSVSEDIAGNNMYWNAIRWQDRVADDANIPLLRGGSFGFLSTDCPARFMRPAIHEQLNKFVDGRGNTYQTYKDQIALPTVTKELGYGDSMSDASFWYQWKIDSSAAIGKWYIPAAKKTYYGIVTPTITQDIRVSTSPAGKSSEEWSDFATVTVSSFEYKTYRVSAHTTTSVGVMLSSVKNDATEPTCDVILDNLEMTQWHAGTMSNIDRHNDDFVYTGAWIEGAKPDTKAELWPLRVATDELQTIRAPFLENGIGAISFSYDPSTLGENACLAIEYLTRDDENRLESYNVPNFTLEDDYQAYWKVYKTFTYDDLVSGGGHITEYLGKRAGKSLIRLRVPQKVIEAAHEQNSGSYGRIDLTGIAVWDEPSVDERSWTAWNVRLANKTTAESEYGSYDKLLNIDSWLDRVGTAGMSMELNNGACEELAEDEPELYADSLPYIQSPILKKPDGSAAEVTIGEITYRARKSGMTSQSAFVEVRAMRENGSHEVIATNELNSVSWQSFTVKNKASNVVSIRLVMLDDDDNRKNPGVYDRAIFDELFVTERVDPNVLVTFARPFRNHLDSTEPVPNISDPEEQPLCGEEWGIQCKLALKQLDEVIDSSSIEVWCDYYIENYKELRLNSRWGYGSWPTNSEKCGTIKLARATSVGESSELIYRMVRRDDGELDYISPITNANTIVQYNFRIKFKTSQDDDEHESAAFNPADPNQWTVPEWYYPVDFNESFSGSAAYTIIDEVAPKRAWINEVNVWDSTYADYKTATLTNAWVEIAVPSGVDMSNWRLEAVSAGNDDGELVSIYPLMTFGAPGCPKSLDSASGDHFAFYVAAHEKSSVANRVAKLSFPNDTSNEIFRSNNAGTTFSERIPFALRLVRPTGVVDHEILLGGCENGKTLDAYYKRLALNAETGHNKTVKAGWDGAKAYDDDGKSVTLSMKNVAGMSDLTAEAAENKWDNTMTETPGAINFANQIAKDYRIYPYDNMARVSCYVVGKCITQALPGLANPSREVQRISVEKGTPVSVFYYLEPWYQIASVKTNNVAVAAADMPKWNENAGAWVFTCSPGEETTIEAVSSLVPELAGLLDEGDHYGDAIVDWLQKEYGNANPSDLNTGIEVLGAGHQSATPTKKYLTLREKYWIGADPTKDGWLEFYAYVDPQETEIDLVSAKDSSITNKLVKLILHAAYFDGTATNKLTRLASNKYPVDSTNWKTLPKEDSFDSWTGNGPALQVVGWMLGNGLISGADLSDYVVPFEYYLLNESSFDDDFNRVVYVSDPFGSFSVVGRYKKWYLYSPRPFVGWSLRLDDRIENVPGYSLNYLSEKNLEQATEK